MADQNDPNQPRQDDTADDTNPLHYGSHQPGKGLVLTPGQKAAAGPQAEPKTVRMGVLRDGSYDGAYRHAGDQVDVPEDLVETLQLSGFAVRSDFREVAERDRATKARRAEADQKAGEKRSGRSSTAVSPMTTASVPGAEPPAVPPTPAVEPPNQ